MVTDLNIKFQAFRIYKVTFFSCALSLICGVISVHRQANLSTCTGSYEHNCMRNLVAVFCQM